MRLLKWPKKINLIFSPCPGAWSWKSQPSNLLGLSGEHPPTQSDLENPSHQSPHYHTKDTLFTITLEPCDARWRPNTFFTISHKAKLKFSIEALILFLVSKKKPNL
jgi:hypothetical protein